MNEGFIIIKESELPNDIVQEEDANSFEHLDEDEAVELAYECIRYGCVLVENRYVDSVCGILEDAGYHTSQREATGAYTYIYTRR